MRDLECEGSNTSEEGSAAIIFILILAVILFVTSQQSHTGAYGLGSHYSRDRYSYTDDYSSREEFRFSHDSDTYSYNRYNAQDLYYRDKFENDDFGGYHEDYFYNPQEN